MSENISKWTMSDILGTDEKLKFEYGVKERLEQKIKENLYLLKAVESTRAASVISSAQYQEYIKSKEWQKTRERIFKRDHYICAICGSAKNLAVHHITYENLGAEKDADLITLCNSCHGTIHSTGFENPFFLLAKAEEMFCKWEATGTKFQKQTSEVALPLIGEIKEQLKALKEQI